MENENRNPGLLCKRGCGFFGASQYDGFCSKCFHEVSLYKQKQQQAVAASAPTSQPKAVVSDNTTTPTVTAPPTISVTAPQTVSNCSSTLPKPITSNTSEVPAPAVPLSQSISTPAEVSEVDSSSIAIPIANKNVTSLANSEDKGLPHVLSAPAFSDGDLLSSSPCNSESSGTGNDRIKPAPNRCTTCRKKVGLTGFPCRCGGVFCSAHRYSDRHECKYDYQADAKRELSKANPVVAASKVERI